MNYSVEPSSTQGSPSELEDERGLRIGEVLAPIGPIPFSKSCWWAGVKSGRYPKPYKLGPRITVWRKRDIIALIASGVAVGEN